MTPKMKAVADEIGRSIYANYDEDILQAVFSGSIVIEDIIFQVLVECCRYAYLLKSEKHPLSYYIERDGKELDLERKKLIRSLDLVREWYSLESQAMKDTVDIDVLKPNVDIVQKKGRYDEYEFTEFDYWELNNIHDMGIVKKIVRRSISLSNVSKEKFIALSEKYDEIVKGLIEKAKNSSEDMVFSSVALFTLEKEYAFDFNYKVATEAERQEIKDIPDLRKRLECTSVMGRARSLIVSMGSDMIHEDDAIIEYPMIIQRDRFIEHMVNDPPNLISDLGFGMLIEANVLANAVQSHIWLCDKPMRKWFAEDTDMEDWASVFETYNVFRVFASDKKWTNKKIRTVKNIYKELSMDYGELKKRYSNKNHENRP